MQGKGEGRLEARLEKAGFSYTTVVPLAATMLEIRTSFSLDDSFRVSPRREAVLTMVSRALCLRCGRGVKNIWGVRAFRHHKSFCSMVGGCGEKHLGSATLHRQQT
jgi:hypothetical protein